MNQNNQNNQISKIIDGLYVGNYNAALDPNIITSHNIHTIVNCTKKKDRINMNVDYLQIPLDDPPSNGDIEYVNINFIPIVTFISNAINSGKNVLVHCIMGAQRSAAIAAIYLMVKFKVNYMVAVQFIKSRRPICFFGNINYINSLVFIQNHIKGNYYASVDYAPMSYNFSN